MINIIYTKLKQHTYFFFLKMYFEYLCSKYKKTFLYVKNAKFRNSMKTLKNNSEN